MILPILQVGEEILTNKASTIESIETYLFFIEDLKDTLKSTGKGVGLAAPQVGRSLRIFLMHPRPTANYLDQIDEGLIAVINPEIVTVSQQMMVGYEGCLSISSQNGQGMLRAEVPRHTWVDVKFQNEAGEWIQRRFDGFASAIFQHEYDHLEGVLFLSRVENWESLRSDRGFYNREKLGKI